MILFIDRSRKAHRYPWLEWKVRLFTIGACLAVGGIVLEQDWLVRVAIAILVVGLLLRFLPGGRGVPPPDGAPSDTGSTDPDR